MRCLLLFVVIALVLASAGGPPSASAQQQEDVANDVIARLNAWRIEADLWPFQPNDTLTAMALDQATYLASLRDFPDDPHAGRNGENPMQRASAEPYEWPVYGRDDRVAIGEVAYTGRNAAAAIQYWQQSTVHRNTVVNAGYREVGAAAVPSTFGYLIIVVFGSRPNVLPALVDPDAGQVYLTNERYVWAGGSPAWVHEVTQIRLFDGEGRPLGLDWQPWQPMLPLSGFEGERFFVLYSDGSEITLSEVEMNTDRVLLPATFVQAVPTPVPTIPPVAAATPVPAATRQAASAPSPTPAPAPTVARTDDVLLVYDSRTLALINISGRALDVSMFALVQGSSRFEAMSWSTPWLNAPLNAFPAQDCLQLWSWNESSTLPAPAPCRTQRSVVNLAPDRLFWTKGDFEVYWSDRLVTTCRAADGQCHFSATSAAP